MRKTFTKILKSIEIDIKARTNLNGTINLLEENIKLTRASTAQKTTHFFIVIPPITIFNYIS